MLDTLLASGLSACQWQHRDARLDSRTARLKLPKQKKPHYSRLAKGLRLGYHRNQGAGSWSAAVYTGDRHYIEKAIGIADDTEEADGIRVFTFRQACAEAHKRGNAPRTERSGPYTVQDAIADYLVVLGGRASHTDTRQRLGAYVPKPLAETRVDALTADTLRSWHRHVAKMPPRLRTKGGAAKVHTREIDLSNEDDARKRKVSANRILGLLKAALNHAFTEGKAASDAEWRRVKPFKAVDQERARYLTVAESQRLINAADGDFRVLVRAALETGARYGHLARLRVADYNPDSGTISVRTTSQPGKQGKGYHIVLTDEGRAFFGELAAGREGTEPLLGREWKASDQQRPMRAACERAKISPPINFHGLRHSWASLAIMNGTPLQVVALNLGHADTRMVERHYGHLAPSYVADAIRAGAPRFGTVQSKVRAIR